MTVTLAHPPIVEAVLDIDCDLPLGQELSALEGPARERFRDHYPTFGQRVLQELTKIGLAASNCGNICGDASSYGWPPLRESSMNVMLKKLLSVALTTGATACQAAGWTGPMPEIAPDDNDSQVRVAKQLGIYSPRYIVPPEACDNYRKNKQCLAQTARPRKSDYAECDEKFPWANNANWNGAVIQACAAPASVPVPKGYYQTNSAEPPKFAPTTPTNGAPAGSPDQIIEKTATDAAAKAIQGLFGR